MEPISEKEIDIFELELAIKCSHVASLLAANPEVSYLFFLSEMALKEKLERLQNHQPPHDLLATLLAERDAAVEDLRLQTCQVCKYKNTDIYDKPCCYCFKKNRFEWRGPKK